MIHLITDPQLAGLAESWELSLRAKNRAETTIESYIRSVAKLDSYLKGATPVPEIRRSDVESFIADQLANWSPSTAGIRYRSLQQFFAWCYEEGEIEANPMELMTPPEVPEVPVPVVSDEVIRSLLSVCEGKDFLSRRDTAIVWVFIETPCRLSEVTELSQEDVSLVRAELSVIGKGSKPRLAPFGPRSAAALDRYLRVRRLHKYASSQRLWLGPRGPLTRYGMEQMLKRRCRQAGLPPLHWHQFRHTFAHVWKSQGGSDGDLMRLAGWSSPAMLRRYGASVADERAREAYRKTLPGERI